MKLLVIWLCKKGTLWATTMDEFMKLLFYQGRAICRCKKKKRNNTAKSLAQVHLPQLETSRTRVPEHRYDLPGGRA